MVVCRASDADAREEVGWCSDARCARAVRPIALSPAARSIPAASCSRRLRLPHNHPDELHVPRIGSSGRVPEAVLAGAVFLPRTWRQPGVWWCHRDALRESGRSASVSRIRVSAQRSSQRSSARIWAELHEQAFRRLGGCPRVVVLDNLREGVAVPDTYDPTVNSLFRDVLAHYIDRHDNRRTDFRLYPRADCEKGAKKSGVTMAGFAPESGVTCMAGFAGARRPHPGRHTATPAAFR